VSTPDDLIFSSVSVWASDGAAAPKATAIARMTTRMRDMKASMR
jgi:hypothetical protein